MASPNCKDDLKIRQLHLLSTELNNLRFNQQLVDVMLIDSERNEYPANKNVLAASSIYFYKNFVQPKQSVNMPIMHKFQLPIGITSKALDVILNFCYTGEIEVSEKDTQLIQDLITSSELVQLEVISQYCSQLALSEITPENFLLHWQFAEKCNNEEMKREIVKIMSKNFVQIQESDSFLDASVNCIEMMLSQDELNIHAHDDVFEALLKWVKKDFNNRVDSIPILFKQNLFENISDDLLNSLSEKESEIIEESKYFSMKTLKEAMYRLNHGSRNKPANEEKKKEVVNPVPNTLHSTIPTSGKVTVPTSSNIKPFNTSKDEIKTVNKYESQKLFKPIYRAPIFPQPPLINGYVGYPFINPPLNQVMQKVDLQYYDRQNPRAGNNRNSHIQRWMSTDELQQGAKPKHYNSYHNKKPNWKQNQRAKSPSSMSDVGQSFNSNKQTPPSSEMPRSKSDKFQPNKNYNFPRRKSDDFSPKKHEVEPAKTNDENTRPAKSHYQNKPGSYKKKLENFIQKKNSTQNQIQNSKSPETDKKQIKKQEPEKIQPVKTCETPKAQETTNENKEIETPKTSVGIFEKYKAKEEHPLSYFTTKPAEVNGASNSIYNSSSEIVIMKSTDEITKIIVLDSDGKEKAIDETEIKLPQDAAICSNGSIIYILGGRDDSDDVFSTFFTYDLISRNWGMLTDLNSGRYKSGAIAIGNLVYVVGGRGEDNETLNIVECYDSQSEKWNDEKPMKIARVNPALCRYKDNIYVYGGDPEAAKTNATLGLFASCEIYNLKTKQWNCIPSKLPIQYSLHHAFLTAVMKGKIFAVTALQDEDNWLLHQYDPRINLWQKLVVKNEKMQSWISLGVFKDEELCFVDAKGGIFKFNLKDEPVEVGNCFGDGDICYAVVLS